MGRGANGDAIFSEDSTRDQKASATELSRASPDEVVAKTDKSSLLGILEKKVTDHGRPDKVTAYIIYGQFLLYSLPPNLPPTYGGLARTILIHSLRTTAKYIHIVFDDCPLPSIKDA